MERLPSPQDSYPGGKAGAGVYQKLINLMPLHTVYIEPFLGHGAVLLRKRPARLNIGVDLYDQAVQKVRTRLQHRQRALICRTPEHGDEAGKYDRCDDDAAATLRTHRQHATRCSSDVSDDDRGRDIEVGAVRYRLLVGDALDFLRSYAFTGSELVYCDPPYVRSARRSRGRAYRYEMDDHQHIELIEILRRLPCPVMLSGYHSALYDAPLHNWRMIEFQAQTRRGPATEVVWMKYPPPTDLHEYTYWGDDFHARDRQKKQQARWAKKVAAKPPLEQKALLAGLLARVGPTVSAEVVRSALAQFGDEDLIASNGSSRSHQLSSEETAARSASEMPRATRCTICRSPARERIDQAIAAGGSLRTIARQEGVSKSVLGRHRAHVPGHAVSHFESGTADTIHRQKSTPRSVQLELLSLDTLG